MFITYISIKRSFQIAVLKNLSANTGDARDSISIPGFRKIPWRRKWQPTPVFFPGKSHGQRSLAGYGPWGHKESNTTERLNRPAYRLQPEEYGFLGGRYCVLLVVGRVVS